MAAPFGRGVLVAAFPVGSKGLSAEDAVRGGHALRSFVMSGHDQHERETTERTPKGLEVPIPKRGEFFENLKKAAEPEKPPAKPSDAA